AAENEVIESRQRNKIVNLGNAAFGAFSEPYRSELGERTDRLSDLLLDRLDSRYKRRADCAHAGNQNSQLSGRLFDLDTFLYHFSSIKDGNDICKNLGYLLEIRNWKFESPISPLVLRSDTRRPFRPARLQVIPVHAGDHLELDFLRADRFAL